MNTFTVYHNRHSELLKELERNTEKGFGYFYIVEFKSNLVKIGCTQQPYSRMHQLSQTLEKEIGYPMQRIAISGRCKFFRKHEAEMHKAFEKERVAGSELFNVSFDEALKVGVFLIEQINKEKEEAIQICREKGKLTEVARFLATLRQFNKRSPEATYALAMAYMDGMAMANTLEKVEV